MKYTKEELDLIDKINQYVSNREITNYKALPKELYQEIRAIMNTKNVVGSLQSYFDFLGYNFRPTSKYPKVEDEIITKLTQYYPDSYVTNLENVDRNLYYRIQDKALHIKVDIPEYLSKLGFHFVFKSNNYSHAPSFYIGKSEEKYIEHLSILFPEKSIVIEDLIEKNSLLFKNINYLRQIRSIQTIEELLDFFGFVVNRRFKDKK
jgi:hypothetical protein